MSAAVDEKVDEAVLEDLDFAAGCEITTRLTMRVLVVVMTADRRCAAPAEWILTCRSCGRRSLVCAEHKVASVPFVCARCGVEGPLPEVVTFERLVP